ncbi:MAG TPA: DUF4157 domain-containing protein [Longimicrobiaceae bacterium]|nr:DUF4157 domain-containing protein [Longimicrobiaceae bacterium]
MSIIESAVSLVLGRPLPSDRMPYQGIPDGVVLREGRLLPKLGGWLARMPRPAAAVTLGRTIIVHPEARLTDSLLRHELAHVRQWSEVPLFALRYTTETLRHGYRQNAYEREAREAEASTGIYP